MGRVAVLATCALNQWALDYQGNVSRIIDSIQMAKAAGARYLCGTELNIVGYGCGDHYHESDTEAHAWEALATVMQHPDCFDIIVDVGLPIMHKDVIYNCKLVFLNRKILLIRPKMILANDGILGYMETRWFTEWRKIREVEDYSLPSVISSITGQTTAPFGDGMVVTSDTTIGYEICEELWNPESCHIPQNLDGAEIISNGIGAMTVYGQPDISYQMVKTATMKSGGCYLLANQKGCDGNQGCYEGEAYIGLNGSIVAYAPLHTLDEVNVITATVDLESIRRYKASIRSRCIHAANSKPYPRLKVDFSICNEDWWDTGIPSCRPMEPIILTKEEQILKEPACWLWDYLRRSDRGGLLLPLSGDVDSSATAAIVFSMCHLVIEAVTAGNEKVLAEVRRLVGQADYVPRSAQDLCGHLVYTLYVATTSSQVPEAKEIVNELSQQIGSQNLSVNLDGTLRAALNSITDLTSTSTSKKCENQEGGGASERLLSRIATSVAYFIAESEIVSKRHEGSLIVLASSDFDNSMKGSGRTQGDINLIGRFPQEDIIKFLHLAKDRLKLPSLEKVGQHLYSNADKEIATCRSLQSVEGCGPYSMFGRLWHMWKNELTAEQVAEKVKVFFRAHNLYRQDMVNFSSVFYMPATGPPFEARPLFYPKDWPWQFKAIDETVKKIESKRSNK